MEDVGEGAGRRARAYEGQGFKKELCGHHDCGIYIREGHAEVCRK